jgi:dethiobiotin synthetase
VKGLFITGTGTGVGKTHVAVLALEALRAAGLRVGVMKPYAAGSLDDSRALARAAGGPAPLRRVTPVYMSRPLAPVARFGFKKSARPAHVDQVMREFKNWAAVSDVLVVEGIGGVLVPLQGRFCLADLMANMGLPAWVVARPGLGTLNHTLLTLEALSRRKVPVTRLVLSGADPRREADRRNPAWLRKLTALPVTVLPRGRGEHCREIIARALRRDGFLP